ncbi:hypothetical protein KY363_06495 [Candidatus Woesearchaeota archaeon]|nr:hypothetical protein [Candidatus Woesearchaeota archaeon]
MVEFNPDGSIKIPAKLAASRAEEDTRMKVGRCMVIRKEIVSVRPPKVCELHLTTSDRITDLRFVENIFQEWTERAEVPAKLSRLSGSEFKVEIGTCFSRCSDCTRLIQKYRVFLDSNVIEKKGGCEYGANRKFSYEDYFD